MFGSPRRGARRPDPRVFPGETRPHLLGPGTSSLSARERRDARRGERSAAAPRALPPCFCCRFTCAPRLGSVLPLHPRLDATPAAPRWWCCSAFAPPRHPICDDGTTSAAAASRATTVPPLPRHISWWFLIWLAAISKIHNLLITSIDIVGLGKLWLLRKITLHRFLCHLQ